MLPSIVFSLFSHLILSLPSKPFFSFSFPFPLEGEKRENQAREPLRKGEERREGKEREDEGEKGRKETKDRKRKKSKTQTLKGRRGRGGLFSVTNIN
jgi:hypothetical protein